MLSMERQPGICRIVLRAKNDLVITNLVSMILLERARVRGSRIKVIHVVGFTFQPRESFKEIGVSQVVTVKERIRTILMPRIV